jgi:hypothetical protein
MNSTTTNVKAGVPPTGRRPRRAFCLGFALAALTLGFALGRPEPAGGAPPTSTHEDRDWQLAYRARLLFLKDTVLAPLNLGVNVRDRVAILWGAVPSPEASRRAEQLVRGLDGILGIRNELQVDPDSGNEPVRAPSSSRSAPRPSPEKQIPRATTEALWTPARSTSQPHLSEKPENKTTANSSAWERGPNGTEPAWQLIGLLPPTSTRSVTPVTRVHRPPLPEPSREAAIAELRQRYGTPMGIEIRLQGDLVFLIWAAGSSTEDLFRLAQALSELPGVERVIVKESSRK